MTALPTVTAPAGTRTRGDAYFTPPALARRLAATLPVSGRTMALEPSAGGGAFVDALAEMGADVYAIDSNPLAPAMWESSRAAHRHVGDFLSGLPRGWPAPDVVAGNPPYRDAEAHVRASLAVVRDGGSVGMLLRLAFLEGQGRIGFWRAFPARRVFVLSERPSFTDGGTDRTAYAFFHWVRGWKGETALEVLSWR